MDPFQHSRMGQIKPFSPQASEYAEMAAGKELWPDIRNQIASFRSGASPTGPKPSAFPGYDNKSAEDQRLLAWILESLMMGKPPESLGRSEAPRGGGDIDFGDPNDPNNRGGYLK